MEREGRGGKGRESDGGRGRRREGERGGGREGGRGRERDMRKEGTEGRKEGEGDGVTYFTCELQIRAAQCVPSTKESSESAVDRCSESHCREGRGLGLISEGRR